MSESMVCNPPGSASGVELAEALRRINLSKPRVGSEILWESGDDEILEEEIPEDAELYKVPNTESYALHYFECFGLDGRVNIYVHGDHPLDYRGQTIFARMIISHKILRHQVDAGSERYLRIDLLPIERGPATIKRGYAWSAPLNPFKYFPAPPPLRGAGGILIEKLLLSTGLPTRQMAAHGVMDLATSLAQSGFTVTRRKKSG